MTLMIRWRRNRDDLNLKIELNRARTRYSYMKKAIYMARKKFEKANPAIASARIAKEKAIKDAAEKKK